MWFGWNYLVGIVLVEIWQTVLWFILGLAG